ncbi:transposable element Tcb1 transposase [Trichonephila clavipes]|nr:transposable element Tcb1 transposase [Trichonephila clavipes]
MRAIGKGGAAARIFCGLMNLPPPPAKFERHNSLFLNVLKTISEDSMNAAVHEAVIANDNNSNIAVAVDGTWHKRGYSSLNGVVCATSVENGKVIDFEALTKYCSSSKRVVRQLGCSDCVGTSGSERYHLHEDQAQDALDRPVVKKTTISQEMHAYRHCFIGRHPGTGHLGSRRRPLRRSTLTPTYRRLRLEWCRARGNWTVEEWNQVVFNNESRLNLSCDENRVRVWRPRGERLNPAFTLQRLTATTAGMSPIEHISDHLGWRVGHLTSLNELETRLHQIWNEMSQEIIQNLYTSMPDRIASCIRATGGSISDEAHFWLNGYVNKQNCRIWSEANPQVYVETPLHPEKLTVWCALWAGGILLQKR